MSESNEIKVKFGVSTKEAVEGLDVLSRLFEQFGKALCRCTVTPPRSLILADRVRATQSRIALESRRHGPGWCE